VALMPTTKPRSLAPMQQRFVEEYLLDLDALRAADVIGLLLNPGLRPAPFYVYGLVDPLRRDLFYVGKGSGRRMYQHADDARRGAVLNGRKHRRMVEVGTPCYLVLAQGLSEREALTLERALVDGIGRERLTNVVRPGRSVEETSEAKAEDLLRRAKPFAQWCAERPRSETERALYWRVIGELGRLASGAILNHQVSPWCAEVVGARR
jgi:hypothetical protein